MMFIVNRANGDYVLPGDVVTSFRGERAEFLSATRAQGPGHTGKVLVKWLDGNAGVTAEYYDIVFGLAVKEIA